MTNEPLYGERYEAIRDADLSELDRDVLLNLYQMEIDAHAGLNWLSNLFNKDDGTNHSLSEEEMISTINSLIRRGLLSNNVAANVNTLSIYYPTLEN